ncbi:MAG: cytidine deaminase [Chitinophagales bacterium]|nr:cytidine deaminase [Chitinophagales bacterium]
MKQQEWKSIYTMYETLEELPVHLQALILAAQKAQLASYAPYSNFYVGAAILLDNGQIIEGSNQENASYPIGLCAERTVLSAKVAVAPNQKIQTIAIVAKSDFIQVEKPVAPCGICRQTLLETELQQEQAIQIVLYGNNGTSFVFNSVKEILPLHFDASETFKL